MPKNKPSQNGLSERESRHINREDDPNFDPADKTRGNRIPGADQQPEYDHDATVKKLGQGTR